jgi:hypothetical protein
VVGFPNTSPLLLSCRSDSSSDSEREASSHSKRHKKNDKPKKVVVQLLFSSSCYVLCLSSYPSSFQFHFLEQGKGPKQESSP